MNGNELIELFGKSGKRFCVAGSIENGVVAGLDLEGRLFAVMNGRVMNRVNPAAILGTSCGAGYLNPGGDGLWPAPEGTCLGYEYSTGKWRVPPGIVGAKFRLVEECRNHCLIEAEIDLINSMGLGVPTIFRRDIRVEKGSTALIVRAVESIKYIGSRTLSRNECLLAPWTLCQFDTEAGCEVIFPETHDGAAWDLYEPSREKRSCQDGILRAKTDGGQKYQIGIDKTVEWIEFRNSTKNIFARRTSAALPPGQDYIDISDVPPERMPSDRGIRFSVYNDPAYFMEIEAVGGCLEQLRPGDIMSVEVTTEYSPAPASLP